MDVNWLLGEELEHKQGCSGGRFVAEYEYEQDGFHIWGMHCPSCGEWIHVGEELLVAEVDIL